MAKTPAKKSASKKSVKVSAKKTTKSKQAAGRGAKKPAPKVAKPAAKVAKVAVKSKGAKPAPKPKAEVTKVTKVAATPKSAPKKAKLAAEKPVKAPKEAKKGKAVDGARVKAGAAAVKAAVRSDLKKSGRKVQITEDTHLYATAGSAICREVGCEIAASVGDYCRLHYIKNWKRIKRREMILGEGKLNRYIEELVAKYPEKYIEAIRNDLANDKEFSQVVSELELDENVEDFDYDSDSIDSLIDNIRRDFEDEEEAY